MFAFTLKKAVIALTLAGVIGGGSYFTYAHFHQHPSASCPQPPRDIDPSQLTQAQRDYYGYPPDVPGKDMTQVDKQYQLHGVHYCADSDQPGDFISPGAR